MNRFKVAIKRIIRFFYEISVLATSHHDVVPIRFFSKRPNVGDALNVYLIEKVTGKRALEIKSGWLRHVLGIGSIMHFATKKSVAWGTGVIEESQLPSASVLGKMKFSAVRGGKTRDLLGQKLGKKLSCPMGDPAVLMPLYYTARSEKKYLLGVVPHYVDKNETSFKDFLLATNAKLIDVELPVEEFIDQLAECEVILSSSLHGLILSDSYGISNIWVKFSDNVIGGEFKFLDYYSTTDRKNVSPIDMRGLDLKRQSIEALTTRASVAQFSENKGLLLESFPARL